MAKRSATVQMTHENWDDEDDEPEEIIPFKAADASILAKRPMKKAKRRFEGSEGGNAVRSSPFSAFKGFITKPAASKEESGFKLPSSGGFSFGLLKPANQSQPVSGGFGFGSSNTNSQSQSSKAFTFGSTTLSTSAKSETATTFKSSSPSSSNGAGFSVQASSSQNSLKENRNGGSLDSQDDGGSPDSQDRSKTREQYAKDLSSLNKSVSLWIQQHIDKNPVCDLTPVFDDYRSHLAKVEKLFEEAKKKPASSDITITSTVKGPIAEESKPAFGGFQFGSLAPKMGEKGKDDVIKPPFQFGSASGSAAFGLGEDGFMFSGVSKPEKKVEEKTEAAANEDEPPKVEFKEVEEKDAIFSRRAKIFYNKKDEGYKEKGVGMLHLKVSDGRGQLLVRADTNLGNIILNVGIAQGLPASRQGKNNVLLMTPLNPPAEKVCPSCKQKYPNPQESNECSSGCTPEATAILMRVKTAEDADLLFEEINKLRE